MAENMQRIWTLIDKRTDGCWIFTRSVMAVGYGNFWTGERNLGAHRAAWIAAHGPIPRGMFVCHSCDVRACCNPDHLFLGTAADNNRDMHSKGRGHRPDWRGERSPAAKYSDEQIAEMRRRRADGEKLKEIAAAFGCTESHVSAVCKGKSRVLS